MSMTLTEKIIARAAGMAAVKAGAEVFARPDHAFAYDFPGINDKLYEALVQTGGEEKSLPPDQRVMFIDHLTTRSSRRIDAVHDETRSAAKKYGFTLHEDLGIGHQVMLELGYVLPGNLLVHFDSHVATAGAHGALGLGISNNYVTVWVNGGWNMRVPASVKVTLTGAMEARIDARDLLHHMVRTAPIDQAIGAVLELGGPGLASIPVGMRQSFCGMSVFTGAATAICLPDDAATDDLRRRFKRDDIQPLMPDADASYRHEMEVDLGTIEPMIVRPGSARPDHVERVSALAGTAINRAFIGSCVSGRIEDIREAASVLRGRHVKEGVEFLIAPSSAEVARQAAEEGLLAELEAAGATVGAASCDYCFGFAAPLAPGETCISTGTLNISGRMGSAKADIYLASAYSVAAAAVAGEVIDPRQLGA